MNKLQLSLFEFIKSKPRETFTPEYFNTHVAKHDLTEEEIIEIAKNTCTLHRTSDDGVFTTWFELNDLKEFVKQLLEVKK